MKFTKAHKCIHLHDLCLTWFVFLYSSQLRWNNNRTKTAPKYEQTLYVVRHSFNTHQESFTLLHEKKNCKCVWGNWFYSLLFLRLSVATSFACHMHCACCTIYTDDKLAIYWPVNVGDTAHLEATLALIRNFTKWNVRISQAKCS